MPASRVNASGKGLLSVFPRPNFTDRTVSAGRYNYVIQPTLDTSQKPSTLKLDTNLGSANSLSATYTHHTDRQSGGMGLATGSAYAACNLPWLFNASPVAQTWVACAMALCGAVLTPAESAAAPCGRR